MVIGTIINIGLDPLLIFGLAGFPQLGFKGAAVATVIARSLSVFVSLGLLHYREKMVSFDLPHLKEVWQSWKALLYVGLPIALSMSIAPLSMGFITALISFYGNEAVAAFGVVSRIENFCICYYNCFKW